MLDASKQGMHTNFFLFSRNVLIYIQSIPNLFAMTIHPYFQVVNILCVATFSVCFLPILMPKKGNVIYGCMGPVTNLDDGTLILYLVMRVRLKME